VTFVTTHESPVADIGGGVKKIVEQCRPAEIDLAL
jgi:hypothetical protein